MDLLLTCVVILSLTNILLIAFKQKTIIIHLVTFLKKKTTNVGFKSNLVIINRTNSQTNTILNFVSSSRTDSNNFEAKRMRDLALEQEQLSNKLKMLEYLSVFELYLNQHKANNYKMCEINEFRALKLSTQKSILESTKKVSYLSVA
ncbi:hypothetical protein FPF71_11940 [Algibacter amylolyticus]|uniref:Uncharacterized protein n=1 Tax=Algibacter amylolyticus TaxID=1608400 RepID=A0A5M7B3G6_9FLAO|nr:hypothetical protein [Algibacter amylolyticus]KAA5823410.1 hypothetical protein F2B50_11940 [Algibacter amylolyticus]MBB5267560.1 hypothetical protein [Algibacter amylolyticus]TSJ73898.1 hypothetical protein FPF71_11940 [Algibacter amylolyticus]